MTEGCSGGNGLSPGGQALSLALKGRCGERGCWGRPEDWRCLDQLKRGCQGEEPSRYGSLPDESGTDACSLGSSESPALLSGFFGDHLFLHFLQIVEMGLG